MKKQTRWVTAKTAHDALVYMHAGASYGEKFLAVEELVSLRWRHPPEGWKMFELTIEAKEVAE